MPPTPTLPPFFFFLHPSPSSFFLSPSPPPPHTHTHSPAELPAPSPLYTPLDNRNGNKHQITYLLTPFYPDILKFFLHPDVFLFPSHFTLIKNIFFTSFPLPPPPPPLTHTHTHFTLILFWHPPPLPFLPSPPLWPSPWPFCTLPPLYPKLSAPLLTVPCFLESPRPYSDLPGLLILQKRIHLYFYMWVLNVGAVWKYVLQYYCEQYWWTDFKNAK